MENMMLFCLLAVLPVFVIGDQCLSPKVGAETYSTVDPLMSKNAVILIEFSVQCKNGGQNLNFYAEFNGQVYPASKQISQGSNNFQVTFSDEYKNIAPGTHNVRFFDEESYADLKKAQRNEENTSSIKSIFTIPVPVIGPSRSIPVQSEFVTAIVAIVIYYLAYNAKCNIVQKPKRR